MTFEQIKKEIYYLTGIKADDCEVYDIMDIMSNKPHKYIGEIIEEYYSF